MLKTWCGIKEIKLCFLCDILISKDALQDQKTAASLFEISVLLIYHHLFCPLNSLEVFPLQRSLVT